MHKHALIWIVLADGAHARILEHRSGSGETYDEVDNETSAEALRPSRDLGSDRPGRSFESSGGARHAMESKSDPHSAAKKRFEEHMANTLNKAAEEKRFEALVLVAPPEVLGNLRRALSPTATGCLMREEDKDLLKLPTAELHARLKTLLYG
jgi:protein required for attachment to host cells